MKFDTNMHEQFKLTGSHAKIDVRAISGEYVFLSYGCL